MNPLKYVLYPPKTVEPAPHPLIIFLHGVGERGDDLELVKKWSLPMYLEAGDIKLSAYVAVPQCPAAETWGTITDALDVMLDHLLTTLLIDVDRVYLTGFSMGGYGTWVWGLRQPERFAALMPVGGSGFIADFIVAGDLERLRSKPLWLIHGALDQAVSVRGADEVAAALAQLGANFGYTRYPDTTHGETSDRAFADMTLYRWLLAQKRDEGQS